MSNTTLSEYVWAYDLYANAREQIKVSGAGIARTYREASGMSSRKFATSLDVSPSWWSKVERGREVLPPDVARQLLELYPQEPSG